MSREMAKGSAPRRIFKPTIPTTRRSTQRAASTGITGGCGGGGGGGIWETGDQNNSCNSKVKGKSKSSKPRGKKEFIQLDATFNGINKIPSAVKVEKAFIGPEVHSNDTRSSQSDSPRGLNSGVGGQLNGLSVKIKSDDEPSYGNSYKTINMIDHHGGKQVIKPGEETEDDVETIQRALYRDDFVSLYDPNEQDMTPIGWKCVSQHQAFKQETRQRESKSTSSIRFDKWAKTRKEEDKMVLFQLPQMLLNSADGHVGKIRMYQSGKMELIDTRTGLVHDLLHTDCQVNPHCDDDDESDNDSDNNSDTDNNSEENELKESAINTNGQFSTDWIKKEQVEDDQLDNRNYDSRQSTTFSKPSTSKSSYLSSSSMQSPSSSNLYPSSSSSSSNNLSSKKSSTSKSSSKNPKANNSKLNRRNKCDKDEENDDDDTDDDDDDDDEDDDERNIHQSYREACTFDGEKVVCLGPISNNELLIGRPRLDKFINL